MAERKLTTWRKQITIEMERRGEEWKDVVSCTLEEDSLNIKFYDGYGTSCGTPFTLWTQERVYFPVVYDGAEWVESVSRNPDGIATEHVGGQ